MCLPTIQVGHEHETQCIRLVHADALCIVPQRHTDVRVDHVWPSSKGDEWQTLKLLHLSLAAKYFSDSREFQTLTPYTALVDASRWSDGVHAGQFACCKRIKRSTIQSIRGACSDIF